MPELARYKIEYEGLKKIETEQLAFIDNFRGISRMGAKLSLYIWQPNITSEVAATNL